MFFAISMITISLICLTILVLVIKADGKFFPNDPDPSDFDDKEGGAFILKLILLMGFAVPLMTLYPSDSENQPKYYRINDSEYCQLWIKGRLENECLPCGDHHVSTTGRPVFY